MKKVLLISLITIVFVLRILIKPNLKGFYQSDEGEYTLQMLFQEKDNNFTEWIDSREIDKGSYEKLVIILTGLKVRSKISI